MISPMTTWLTGMGFRDDGGPLRYMRVEPLQNGRIDVTLTEWIENTNDRQFFGGCGDTVEEAMANALNALFAKQGEENANEKTGD